MGKFSDETIFICECISTEHQIVFTLDKELPEFPDETPMLYMSHHLIKKNFWYRLKYGIKYIFGYKSRYGAFDEFIFQPEDADKLLKIADQLKILENKYFVKKLTKELNKL